MASFANPSRDPMATALAPDTTDAVDAVESDTSTGRVDSDDEPQVFIGPPTVSWSIVLFKRRKKFREGLSHLLAFVTGRRRPCLAQRGYHLKFRTRGNDFATP